MYLCIDASTARHTVIQKGKRFFVADDREHFFEIQD
jgi:hypothetical protein